MSNAAKPKETKKPKAPKQKMSNKKFLGIWIPVLAVTGVILLVANVAIGIFGNWIGSQFGNGTYTVQNTEESESWDLDYYKSDFEDLDSLVAASGDLIAEIASEGTVLAKNDEGGLPLSSGAKVTMLGRAAADPVYGGQGSGSVDVSNAVNARQGLENAGIQVNEQVYDAIAAHAAETPRGNIVMDKPDESTYYIGEMPVAGYEAVSSSFADYSDAALVFIGRGGGEGGDLTRNMEGWDDNYEEGQHQLELNKDERDLIDLATKNFDKVVVLINASTSMELGDLEANDGVDSILLIGSPGLTGFNGVGKIISGEVNPSGKTVDVWASDFTKDPTFNNFGDFKYNNLEVSYPTSALGSVASNADVTSNATFVNYAEGIYVGYRYYETAAAEGFINYDEAIVYPFGYGLSYTDFSWEMVNSEMGDVDGEISVEVAVTNNGTVAGKDVVEVYYTAPYTRGGIEKSEVVLAGFAKTPSIAPGSTENVTVTFSVEDMASYDYQEARAYVLDEGDYKISVRTDSHNSALEPLTYKVAEKVVYDASNPRSTDAAEVTNQFDDVSSMFSNTKEEGKVLNLSRADFAGTFPQPPSEDLLVANDTVKAGFAAYDAKAAAEASDVEQPTLGKDSDLTLVELRGLPFDDPAWDELMNSLTVNEMTEVLLNGAYQTAAIASIAKPATTDLDGPAGFSSFINASINGPAYTSEVVIAQTWNVELAEAMGTMLGNEALLKDVNGWYAPAANLHRSPFGGRNFEYYSEDPFLSGEIMSHVSNGAAQKGLYTALKHFAMNEQETNRVDNGTATWATEQTIREIYLKPFEMAVKRIEMPVPYIADESGTVEETTVGSTFIMSSFNRIGAVWAGGSVPLMTNVLRGEWGFEGAAITDFNLYPYMNPDQGIDAGSNLMLTFAPSKSFSDTSSALAQHNIQESMKAINFMVANSNAMNGLAPGATVTFHPPMWHYLQWGVTGVLGALWVAGLAWVVIRTRKSAKAAKA